MTAMHALTFEPRPNAVAEQFVAGINVAPGSDDDGWNETPPVRLADGTDVQLYKDGEALHAACCAIEQALREICLEIYIFHSDDTGRALADRLSRRARDGVVVRVIYDAFGSIDTDPRMFDDMRRAGVQLEAFHPVQPWRCRDGWRVFNRDHRKLLVVDDEVALLGGHNLGNEYGSSWVLGKSAADEWRDTGVGVRGPSARLLATAFARMWDYVVLGGPIHRAQVFPCDPRNNTLLQIPSGSMVVLASTPTPRSKLLPSLLRLLSRAQSSIELTMAYFAPPQVLVEQLCRSARRGIRVRLMLPGRSDVGLLRIAAQAFYEDLLAAGVEVYERQQAVLHAKTLCVDGQVSVIGSTNLDYRSIQFNCELSAVIHSRALGGQMHDLFENDVRYARRIVRAQWRHRPVRDRLMQWAVMRMRYLL
jgi:cardiolipin synthase A/B